MSKLIAPLHTINDARFSQLLTSLYVLRLDQVPSTYSGNKYFKLKINIEQAKTRGLKCLVSFGGAYSNHIHALALAGQQNGLNTVGIIRGEKTTPLNPTLSDAEQAGMALRFVSRQEYRLKNDNDYLASLAALYKDSYIIPEGGSNLNAVRGCMEIVDHIHHHIGTDYDVIVLPCGTAATLAGVLAAVPRDKYVIGISVLKNAKDLELRVIQHLNDLGIEINKRWRIEHDYHCGGYAKINKELVNFMTTFQQRNKIDLEPIYTGKMFYALCQLLEKNIISSDARVITIHTGGLQGLRGMAAKMHMTVSK